VYADTSGNIGWFASGFNPIRKNWTGLLPVPGDSGNYEWSGYVPVAEMPQVLNPPKHFINTSNNNILPAGYTRQVGYDWALPYRAQRVKQMLDQPKKFTVEDFERMQYDVVSLPAQRLQSIVKKNPPHTHPEIVQEFLNWDARMLPDSRPALVSEMWLNELPASIYPLAWKDRTNLELVLKTLETQPNAATLEQSLDRALGQIEKKLPNKQDWKWSAFHTMPWRHPLGVKRFDLPSTPRLGDANTVDASGGPNGSGGASYREILDLADWDRSMMTNTPGESGDPESKHYSDLLNDWETGRYHPMPYSRKAVEAATEEKILLEPK
jgi:penicillin amidase